MNLVYPVQTFSVRSNQIEMKNDICGLFGVWSRYNSLSNIVQVGDIGILYSNCFHLFNAQEQTTKTINFLHYEYLDLETKRLRNMYNLQIILALIILLKYQQMINFMRMSGTILNFDYIQLRNDLKFIYKNKDNNLHNNTMILRNPFMINT